MASIAPRSSPSLGRALAAPLAALAAGAAAFGAGLTACDDGDRNGARRSAADASPHLRVDSCALPSGDSSVVAKLAGSLGNVDVCWVYADGTVRVAFDATPKATLIAGGARQVVPDSGRVEVTIDLAPAIARAPITSAIGDGAGVTAPPFDVRLEPPGAPPITGQLVLSLADGLPRRTRAALAAVAAGTLAPRDPAAPIVRGSLVLVPADPYASMKAIGKQAALGQLDLVAIARDGARHPAADCGPYDNFGMLPHVLVDEVVTVYEASTAKKLAEQTFDSGHEGCAMFVTGYGGQKPLVESRPAAELIEQYLATVTASR